MKEKKEQKLSSQLLKYGVAGVLNSIFGILLFNFQIKFLNINDELANIINYTIGFFTSFYLNRKFTFKSDGSAKKEMKASILVYIASFAFQFALFTYLKYEQMPAMEFLSELGYYLTPQFIINIFGEKFIKYIFDPEMFLLYWGIIAFASLNFSLNRMFTFKKKK